MCTRLAAWRVIGHIYECQGCHYAIACGSMILLLYLEMIRHCGMFVVHSITVSVPLYSVATAAKINRQYTSSLGTIQKVHANSHDLFNIMTIH